MLRRALPVGLALVVFLPVLLCADDAPKTQDKDLDGKWVSVSVVDDGEEVNEVFETILIEGDKWTMTAGARITIVVDGRMPPGVGDSFTLSGRIKVNPESWAIDFLCEDGPAKGKTIRRIYNINKDVLLLCESSHGEDRPTEFSTKKGSGCTLYRRMALA